MIHSSRHKDMPPSDWFDWVAVDRALGEREPVGRPLTKAEKRFVAKTIVERGGAIGDLLRVARMNHTSAKTYWREAGGWFK